jgi:hypothetical protein
VRCVVSLRLYKFVPEEFVGPVGAYLRRLRQKNKTPRLERFAFGAESGIRTHGRRCAAAQAMAATSPPQGYWQVKLMAHTLKCKVRNFMAITLRFGRTAKTLGLARSTHP